MEKYIEYLERRMETLCAHYEHYVAQGDFAASNQMWARMNELQAMHYYFTKGADK